MAQRFVAAVEREDFASAEALLMNERDWERVVSPPQSFKADRVYAELLPREWEDVWRCQRRIVLRVVRHNDRNGNYVDWTEDTDIVASPQGLKVKMPGNLNFFWPAVVPDSQPAIINPGEGIRLETTSRTG